MGPWESPAQLPTCASGCSRAGLELTLQLSLSSRASPCPGLQNCYWFPLPLFLLSREFPAATQSKWLTSVASPAQGERTGVWGSRVASVGREGGSAPAAHGEIGLEQRPTPSTVGLASGQSVLAPCTLWTGKDSHFPGSREGSEKPTPTSPRGPVPRSQQRPGLAPGHLCLEAGLESSPGTDPLKWSCLSACPAGCGLP